MPNVGSSPRLSSKNERSRLGRLQIMHAQHGFMTAILGEIVEYDQLEEYGGSIERLRFGAFMRTKPIKERRAALKDIFRGAQFYRTRAFQDSQILADLQREISSPQVQKDEFLARVAHLGLDIAIVARHADLEAYRTGTWTFNPVGDSLVRVELFGNPSYDQDPYTMEPSADMQQHIAAVIIGLSSTEISDNITAEITAQQKRLSYWNRSLQPLSY